MKSLIKKLQDGEIAVKNDGSVEDLRRILKVAFPRDLVKPMGFCTCYLKSSFSENHWKTDYSTDLPLFSTSEFIKELDSMEKTRTITSEQAQSIIDSACKTWKERLAKVWHLTFR